MVPAEGGPNVLKRKSSWHQRRRSKTLAVSLKYWKGRRGGRGLVTRTETCGVLANKAGTRQHNKILPSSCAVRPLQYITAPPPPRPRRPGQGTAPPPPHPRPGQGKGRLKD